MNRVTVISFFISFFLIYQVSSNLYHRYWSHKQFSLIKSFEVITSFLGLFVMTGDPVTFARTHRWHHAYADTDKDPHSPLGGRFHSFIGWLFKESPITGSGVDDLLIAENRYLYYLAVYQVSIMWICLFVLGFISVAALLGVTFAMCFAFLLEMLTNAYAHSVTQKRAIDVKILAWLSLGSYHAEHHDDPQQISKSDPGYLLLKSFERIGLLRFQPRTR